MKNKGKKTTGAVTSPLIRRPIRRCFAIFLLPTFVCFCIGFLWPFIQGIYLSFNTFTTISDTTFVRFENYAKALEDASFRRAFWYTALVAGTSLVLINVLAFAVAYGLTRNIRGRNLYRGVFFVPNLIGGIVLGYIWQFIFSNVLTTILNSPHSALASTNTAFIAIIVVYVWQYAGYIMLIYINGLATVPKDVLEAAQIDGANDMTTLFKIKIPMIAATFTICTFLTLTSAFKQFDVNLALTNGVGTVRNFMGQRLSNGTQMIALNIYNTAFARDMYGYAQAKAILFFIILATVSLIQVRISNKREVEM